MATTPKMNIDITFDRDRTARDLAMTIAYALSDVAGRLLNTFAPESDEIDDDLDEGAEKNITGDDWTFTPDENGQITLSSAIFQALGGASTAWENPAGAGEFDSTRAREIGDALLELIERGRSGD